VLQLCYNGISMVLQWRYNYVTMVLQWCLNGDTMVFQWCYNGSITSPTVSHNPPTSANGSKVFVKWWKIILKSCTSLKIVSAKLQQSVTCIRHTLGEIGNLVTYDTLDLGLKSATTTRT
jgi:hypothetical protein